MEVDKLKVNRAKKRKYDGPKLNKLIKKERKKLLKSGACFRCRKQGHMGRDCPNGKRKTSEAKAKLTKNIGIQNKLHHDQKLRKATANPDISTEPPEIWENMLTSNKNNNNNTDTNIGLNIRNLTELLQATPHGYPCQHSLRSRLHYLDGLQ
ncbi:hypothetical protein HDV00_012612 [Rhizophlyctis rosea]|nr:hypothetical protein HDV00_012612 [Rhizophlyctis rosea]